MQAMSFKILWEIAETVDCFWINYGLKAIFSIFGLLKVFSEVV
jgi:hypothetical protein